MEIIINSTKNQSSSSAQTKSWTNPYTWPWQKITLGLVVFIVLGFVVTGLTYWQERQEQARQQQVAVIEKLILDKQNPAKKDATEPIKPEELQKEIQDLRVLVQKYPKHLSGQQAAILLADLYTRWNKIDEVVETIQPTLLTPSLPGLLLSYRKVEALLDLKRFDEAIALVEESLKKDHEKQMHAEFYYLKGIAFLAKDNPSEAKNAFQVVVDMKLAEGSTIKKKAAQYILWLESR